jgi:Uma2 family endonuclease
MVDTLVKKLTKAEFWAIADAADLTYELIDGVAVAKIPPKYFHSRTRSCLVGILDRWSDCKGRVNIGWAINLTETYTPVPDLSYVSFDRLPAIWEENAACPVAPELAIEIISPGQTFGQMIQKASIYLNNNVLRVWIIDPSAQSLTVFYADTAPVTYTGEQLISDPIFPDLSIVTDRLF